MFAEKCFASFHLFCLPIMVKRSHIQKKNQTNLLPAKFGNVTDGLLEEKLKSFFKKIRTGQFVCFKIINVLHSHQHVTFKRN